MAVKNTFQEMLLSHIAIERASQDDKWGEQNHDPVIWLGILMEEVGELAQTILSWHFDRGRTNKQHVSHSTNMRNEAIQVASVAVAFIECLERNGYDRE
jgi:NTP pyrophosphatase (non-canonical NTP hydrolase)